MNFRHRSCIVIGIKPTIELKIKIKLIFKTRRRCLLLYCCDIFMYKYIYIFAGGRSGKFSSDHEGRNGRDNGKRATERYVKRLRRRLWRVVCSVRVSRRKKRNRTSCRTWSSAAIVWATRNRNTGNYFKIYIYTYAIIEYKPFVQQPGRRETRSARVVRDGSRQRWPALLWIYIRRLQHNNIIITATCILLCVYSRGESLSPGMDDVDSSACCSLIPENHVLIIIVVA